MRLPVQGSEEKQMFKVLNMQSCPFDYLVQESSEVALVRHQVEGIMKIMINVFSNAVTWMLAHFFAEHYMDTLPTT